ncbi:hypothetical protein [Caulobacter sp. NIBR1757]|uniref:hypothetical protein n=1 Tax=Caulobacter sp. NIBR1757 TaxID=3016000 RepID=UPI0022F0B1C0|nr:hypothetical protein [Caulobacter sp. NIBR1757]WGM38237.1 hypothetical protein AMEJIAPC_01139 [Caulobacter sp. NIBR1757]
MSRRDRQIAAIERRWKARFGEPPSLRTDPELMLRILEDDERKCRAAMTPHTCHPSVA